MSMLHPVRFWAMPIWPRITHNISWINTFTNPSTLLSSPYRPQRNTCILYAQLLDGGQYQPLDIESSRPCVAARLHRYVMLLFYNLAGRPHSPLPLTHSLSLPLSLSHTLSVHSNRVDILEKHRHFTHKHARLSSAVFLINVVRVLCNKLHPGTAQLAPLALQKALRATLILVNIDRYSVAKS